LLNPVTKPSSAVVASRHRATNGISRRAVLETCIGALALQGFVQAGNAQQADFPSLVRSVLGEGKTFEFNVLVELARQLARRPFMPLSPDLPSDLRSLSFEQYQAIHLHKKDRIWNGEGRGFAIEPLHRGFVYQNPVTIYLIEDGTIRRILYDSSRFDFGGLPSPTQPDLDFSGFRLMFQGRDEEEAREIASFQGASFFRGLAKGQVQGLMARGLTLRPADAKGEEFPIFRAFWIERPALTSNEILAHALLDSDSVCGAYRFTIRPGEETIIDVEATFFARTALDHVGYASTAGMFLLGPASHRVDDDVRPAVHDANGLQLHTGLDEWIWRPLTNPETLQISVFVDQNPKGFGLLQRNRDYAAFQDDEKAFERRPSLWIEPIGDWSHGAVQLLEIPSTTETNANILSYWRPSAQIPPNIQTSFAFRQYWAWVSPDRPAFATVVATRSGHGSAERRRRFLVDFMSPKFTDQAAIANIGVTSSAAKGTILDMRLAAHFDWKVMRVSFELDPGGETLCELRVALTEGGKPASETWLYRWTS
jgi:periplasmic glucans biosynthesis protein